MVSFNDIAMPTENWTRKEINRLIYKYKLYVGTIGIQRKKIQIITDLIKAINYIQMPIDLLVHLLLYIKAKQRTQLAIICRRFHSCVITANKRDPTLAFQISLQYPGHLVFFNVSI